MRSSSLPALILLLSTLRGQTMAMRAATLIIDHTCTDVTQIPERAILQAKVLLHIAYGHTSHGSQIIDGMTRADRVRERGRQGALAAEGHFRMAAWWRKWAIGSARSCNGWRRRVPPPVGQQYQGLSGRPRERRCQRHHVIVVWAGERQV